MAVLIELPLCLFPFVYIFLYLVRIEVDGLDVCPFQQVDAIREPVLLAVDHPLYSSLDDKLGAFYAWRRRDIECGAVAVVSASCQFRYGVRLGVEHVWLCNVVLILTDIVKSAWRAVVSVGDNHLVLYHECSDLPPFAVAVLRPYACHAQVAVVEEELFALLMLLF